MNLKPKITGAATLLTIFCGIQNVSLASPLGYVMNNLQFGTWVSGLESSTDRA